MLRLTFALLLTALPVLAQEELPEGYPPKMGEVTGTLGDQDKAWETFDFSIGAFDASAWADADYNTGIVSAHVMGYPPGEPDMMAGRMFAKADFGRTLRTGKGRKVEVAILQGDDLDGARLSSEGQTASFVIESIGPKVEDSYSRQVVGRIEARLCPVDWAGQACQDLVLRFDTQMQIGTALTVRE